MYRHFVPATFAGLAVATGLFAPAPCLAQATSYNISTIAGNGTQGFSGDTLKASQAEFNEPVALAFDSQGNLYIADSGNQRIRMIANSNPLSNGKISTVAGIGSQGYAGDGGPAVNAEIKYPYGIVLDSASNLYIADTNNDVVRKVDASSKNISTIAGVNGNYGYFSNQDGGPANQAYLDKPVGLAMDQAGNLYIADSGTGGSDSRVRVVSAASMINTFAGNGWTEFQGDGGPAAQASVNEPLGLAVDGAGNVYIADADNNCIRKVASNGIITTVAGVGGATGAFSGDGGPATSAKLNHPSGVVATAGGDLFIADTYNQVIRMVSGVTGIITTVAGEPGQADYTGDGGPATNAKFHSPTGLALDSNGNVYVADADNNVIRMLTPNGPTVSSAISASGFGAFTSAAPGSWIEIYGANLAVDGRSWLTSDFQGSTAPTNLDGTTVTIGGQQAFISFISGGQVNALVPSNVSTGQQQVVVKTAAGSASSTVNLNAVEPGLLAGSGSVPAWLIAGTPYVVAQLTQLGGPPYTYVLPPNAIPGVPSRRAQAGDLITLYGIGFGAVSPTVNAGQPGVFGSLMGTLQISIGGVQVPSIQYEGLVPGSYGLYQFNVPVPTGLPANDKTPLTFSLNGTNSTQTLYLAVQ